MTTPEAVAKWTQMPVLGYDVETTGTDVHEDRIVTAAIVRFNPGQRPLAFNWTINPGIPIPEEAAAIHGVTTEHALEVGVDPAVALFEISARLALWMGKGWPVVAFNAAYDLSITEAENRRHGLPTLAQRLDPKPVGPIIDPYVLDKKADQYRKGGRTLTVTAEHYGVPLSTTDAHSAEPDAVAAVRLFHAIATKHPETFRGMTLGGLHIAQAGWRRTQMDGLRAYFDKQGTVHDGCDGSWPMLTTPTTTEGIHP